MVVPPHEVLRRVTTFLETSAREGIEGRDLYIALRAMDLAIAVSIKKRYGPGELATLQEIAFEVASLLKTIEIREDGSPIP